MAGVMDVVQLADDAVERLKTDVEVIVVALRRYLTRLLQDAEVDADGRIVDSRVNAELAAKLEASFSGILRDLGYDGALDRLLTSFDAVAEANEAHLGDTLGVSFSTANRENLTSFVNGVADELVHLEGVAGDKLRQVMLLGASTHVPRDELVVQLADAAGLTLRQAVNEADTSIMAFQREGLISEAEDAGFDLFTYDGPCDALTRPFCLEHVLPGDVGRIYTVGDLDAEDNGQGLSPTSRYLGGYRCRHSLSACSLERALRLVESHGDRVVGGDEARRIVLGGKTGAREAAFVAAYAGAVTGPLGRQQVVRRRRRAA